MTKKRLIMFNWFKEKKEESVKSPCECDIKHQIIVDDGGDIKSYDMSDNEGLTKLKVRIDALIGENAINDCIDALKALDEPKPESKAYKEGLYEYYAAHKDKKIYISLEDSRGFMSIAFDSPYHFCDDEKTATCWDDRANEGFNVTLTYVVAERWVTDRRKIKDVSDFYIRKETLDMTEDEFVAKGTEKINKFIEDFKAMPIGSIGKEFVKPRISYSTGADGGYFIGFKLTRKMIIDDICYAETIRKFSNADNWLAPEITKWSEIKGVFTPKDDYIDPEFNFE